MVKARGRAAADGRAEHEDGPIVSEACVRAHARPRSTSAVAAVKGIVDGVHNFGRPERVQRVRLCLRGVLERGPHPRRRGRWRGRCVGSAPRSRTKPVAPAPRRLGRGIALESPARRRARAPPCMVEYAAAAVGESAAQASARTTFRRHRRLFAHVIVAVQRTAST